MATGDLSVANGVIKIVGGKITKQYEESALLHNQLQKNRGTKIGDRGVEIPTHLTGNYNHAFMADAEEFPINNSNVMKRTQIFFKNFTFTIQLSNTTINSINSINITYIKN